ncbi:hypothetical protein EKO27_g207 [Xylaria grammica]|uniref:Uncharacterized protein n=1 Tax=Xylaria grammica TaxID=363999 RepID=A0A439DKL5_9PEZI|nr:hypothetical protein EKO27_g207 [Xylaria grammica]
MNQVNRRPTVTTHSAGAQVSTPVRVGSSVGSNIGFTVAFRLPSREDQIVSPREGARQPSVSDERERRTNQTTVVGPVVDNAISHHGLFGGNGSIRPVTRSVRPRIERNVTSTSEPTSASHHPSDVSHGSAYRADEPEIKDFVDLDLTCSIDAEGIANRWLGAYIPLPDQRVKDYPATIKSFLHRMVKSYVTVTIRGRGYPPFIHAAQLATHLVRPPLSTCLSLVRICEHQLPGSEETAADVLQREMHNIYEQRESYDTITLLGAFQAYLIFTMVLFFRLGQIANPILRQAVMNLQELACASAKKRSSDWTEGGLRTDELWPVPEDFKEADVIKRRNRVDRWLEGVDEFGTMLYAVTSCTHG